MTIKSTYIVTHSSLMNRLKQINHFKMDLGSSIVNKNNMFQPSDMFIQKHYTFYGDIIHCLGFIGSLPVYSQNKLQLNTILFCNELESFNYKLNDMLSLYDNINTGLDLFFQKIGLKSDVSTVKEAESKPAPYVAPNKPLAQYTEDERIALIRSGAANRLPSHVTNQK